MADEMGVPIMAAKLHFRTANTSDIPAMSAIRLAVRENALSDPSRITPQMYEDYLHRLGRGWVCELDGKIVGFSYAEKANASIWALFVLPEHEGLGVGKGLLRLAVDWLFSLGHNEVTLGTAANTRADRFYAAQGWTRLGMKNAVEVSYKLSEESLLSRPCNAVTRR
jgi:GNAT superfamily N-acetyltransferase